MLAQTYTGAKLLEINRHGAADFDLATGAYNIEHDTGLGECV